MQRWLGVRSCWVILVMATVAAGSPSPAAAAGPVSWRQPVVIDHEPPYSNANVLTGVSCPSASFCAAVDGGGNVATSTDPEGGWHEWSVTKIDPKHELRAISCPSASFCVAIDDAGNVLSSTDPPGGRRAWRMVHVSDVASGRDSPGAFEGISCPSASLCVVVDLAGDVLSSTNPTGGSGSWRSVRVDSGGVNSTQQSRGALQGVSCPSVSLCVAVDSAGDVLTATDPTGGATAWSVSSVDQHPLAAISCASASLCVAADENGNVVSSENPTGGNRAWAAAHADTGVYDCVNSGGIYPCQASLTAISCPSRSLCVAVDNAGNAISSTDPSAGASAWQLSAIDSFSQLRAISCASSTWCMAGDASGNAVTSSNPTGGSTAWTATQFDGTNSLTAVSCPSVSLCVALDDTGRVLASADPAAGTPAWSSAPIAARTELSAVSCPSVALCVAVGRAGRIFTSTSPTRGASAWTATNLSRGSSFIDTAAIDSVSCPSVSLCVAVNAWGNVFASRNPTGGPAAWSSTRIEPVGGPRLWGVACPSISLCIAVDEAGNVLTSRNPTGGPVAWRHSHVSGTGPGGLSSVWCRSDALCLASDPGGRKLFTSANPARGARSWKSTTFKNFWPYYGSCASRSLCVVIDSSGHAMTTTDPTGGASAWTLTPIHGGPFTSSVSCNLAFCAVVDNVGGISLGVPAPAPTSAQLRALLGKHLVPTGPDARIAAVLKRRGYLYSLQLPATGRLTISWYLTAHSRPTGAHRTAILIASANAHIPAYANTRINLRLTPTARRLLAASRGLKLTARARFTPTGKHAILVTKAFKLGPAGKRSATLK